jgi:hypothetical protein
VNRPGEKETETPGFQAGHSLLHWVGDSHKAGHPFIVADNLRKIMAHDHTQEAKNRAPDQAIGGLGEAATAAKRGPAPVHLWNPPYCGEIDMRIAADGVWYYMGSPIGRAPLVQLFSSILRKDGDQYVMVTPVERVGIKVDDAPFLAVEMHVEAGPAGSRLVFRTQVEDVVAIDAEHPLRFDSGAADGVKPYFRVRGDLWALVKRSLFYDLVALGRVEPWQGEDWFGVRSSGVFFPMRPASEIEGL